MNSVQKKFLNQEFLYGISLFCLLSENSAFLHSKILYFCIFFAQIGVLNPNRVSTKNFETKQNSGLSTSKRNYFHYFNQEQVIFRKEIKISY